MKALLVADSESFSSIDFRSDLGFLTGKFLIFAGGTLPLKAIALQSVLAR